MRRRKKRLKIQPKIILRICLFFCVAMLFISFRYSNLINPIKTSVGNFITPMQIGINTIGTYITSKLDLFQDIKELKIENEIIRQELESLKLTNSTLTSDLYELNHLRELYQVGEKYGDYEKIAARVTGKDSNSYYSVFTIDKGFKDGILVDMNVLAGNGLCGIVIEVGTNYAKIRTIIDDNSYVSGMFLETSDTCDVKGDLKLLDEGYIRAEAISVNAEIYDNMEIVTSHISDKYLQGILIGYVSHIEVDASNMTKKAYVRPVVDFEHLKEVLVITQLKEAPEELPNENTYEAILKKATNVLTTKEKEKLMSELLKQVEEEQVKEDEE